MIVIDGAVHFNCSLEELHRGLMIPKAKKLKVVVPHPNQNTLEIHVYARVYSNMWIIDCPWCKNAELVFKSHPKFMCTNCWNQSVQGLWVNIYFPYNVDEIENVLMKRPVPETRNWFMWESVEDLIKENLSHGIE